MVVSADPQGDDVTIAFVSSAVPAPDGPFDLAVREGDPAFAGTGLRRSSVCRVSKLVTVSRSLVARRLGRLAGETQKLLDERPARALGLSR